MAKEEDPRDSWDVGRGLTAVGVIGNVLFWLYVYMESLTGEEWLGLAFVGCLLSVVGGVFTRRGVAGTLRTLLEWLFDFTAGPRRSSGDW